MNIRICTGYLTQAAAAAFVPPAEGAAAVRKLVFDLIVKDSRGVEFPEKCVVEDAGLQKLYEPKLVPGAAVLVHGETCARPFSRNGVQEGFTKTLRVLSVEFLRVPRAAGGEEGASR